MIERGIRPIGRGKAASLVAVVSLMIGIGGAVRAASHSDAPPIPVLSGKLPVDVVVPNSVANPTGARPYFDTTLAVKYSSRAFA